MSIMEGILKNSIKFLHNISDAMPNTFPSAKSYYASKSRILELRGNLYLPRQMTKSSVRCPRCCLSFTDYPPSSILKPKMKLNRFTKKIIRKMEDGKHLTSYQKKYSEHLRNTDCNIISKTCQNCKNETNIKIKMEVKCSDKKAEEGNQKVPVKRKKKKDRFCGLIESAVINTAKEREQIKPIKYNIFGTIEKIKLQENEIKKKPVNKNKIIQKSSKEKIIEKKKNKAKQKGELKLKNLLSGSNKSKLSTNLKNFLQDL